MESQSYSNHIRFYYPHHFIFYPVILLLSIIAIDQYISDSENRIIYVLITAAFILLGWLSFMLRQHYALGNQNRIIRLEMRLRFYQLTNKRFDPLEQNLSFGQIASLRFASDEELPELTEKAINQNLSPKEIKKSIKSWQADYMRA
ncbi:MAG TPA: DUF6526 family protein [Pedobacter sp.]